MKSRLLSTLLLCGAVLASGVALAAAPVKTVGGVLVNTAGMTLYTFDNDAAGSGKSVCNGPCAGLWPPVMVEAGAAPEGDMTIITRDDGAKQWAYKGKPVYLYKSDMKAGDVTGDNFKNVWHIIKP